MLGLIESRPQGTDPLLIKEYISHFLRIALEKDGFFDEDDIETFFGALIDTLGVGNLMEAVRISAPRQGRFGRIGQNFAFVRRLQRSSRQTITTQQLADQPVFAIAQHLLASPASGYWIHYKGNVPQAIFTYDDPINPHIVSQAPLPTWYSDSEIDPLLQQQSAYNESTKMLQNSVGQVNELLNALPI